MYLAKNKFQLKSNQNWLVRFEFGINCNFHTVSMAPFFLGAMNDVSLELTLLVSSSAILALAAAAATTKFGLFESVWCSCVGTDNASLVPKRDGVCDRDVARDEHRDDGLELRDCRKSSNGISSDLFWANRNVEIIKSKNSIEKKKQITTDLGRGVRGLDSRDRIFPFAPLTRFRDGSLDLAPPDTLFGDRSL